MSAPIDSSHKMAAIVLGKLLKTQRDGCPQQGLTILECLVAILLIGLTIAMVTPPLLIATATRVQNRRAEQALQLAQDEVDRVNTLVQQGLHEKRRLPSTIANGVKPRDVAGPTTVYGKLKTSRRVDSNCPAGSPYSNSPRFVNTNEQLPVNQALPIDVDGDCKPEFFMQIFRTEGVTTFAEQQKPDTNRERPATFILGVRVYSALAKDNLVAGKLASPQTTAQLGIGGGQGQQATNPLFAVYKTLTWSEESDALCSSLSATDAKKIDTCPQQ